MFRAAAIDLLGFRLPRPDFQQRIGSLPVIGKREWQLSTVIQQVFFQPSVVLAHIGGLIQVSCLDVIRHETESDDGQGKAPRYVVSRGHTGGLSCVSGALWLHSARGSFPKS